MNSKKEELELAFRQSVKQAEENLESRSSPPTIRSLLDALHIFLTKWDTLQGDEGDIKTEEDENRQTRDLPEDYIRRVFCRILSNLNPVDSVDLVRENILSTLRCVETVDCRQIVLDFLPAVTKIFPAYSNGDAARNEGQSKKVKKEIISCLKEVFENDSNSLPQILRFFSSFLAEGEPQNKVLDKRDYLLFIIGILPKVPETNLHGALKALIEYIDSAEDARRAVDSIRTELGLLEKTDISDMGSVAKTFDVAIRGSKKAEKLFVEEYLVVVGELIDERKEKKHKLQLCDAAEFEAQILTFDLVVIILSKDNPGHRDKILGMISGVSPAESGLMSDSQLSKLKELVSGNHNCTPQAIDPLYPLDSNLHERLFESLVDFCMIILLTPLRRSVELDSREFFSKANVLLLRVISILPDDCQLKAISAALGIVDELRAKKPEGKIAISNKNRSKSYEENHNKICQTIFSLLLTLSSAKTDMLKPFQNRLEEYIISGGFDSTQELDMLKTLCIVVTKLACTDKPSGGLDLLMICRTLLFSTTVDGRRRTTSQFDEFSIQRRIRGMVFLKVVISCCCLDTTMLMGVQKMISRILVSPHSGVLNLDPRVGFHGMQIIRHLQQHTTTYSPSGKELFRLVSLVLTHSRIVHYPDDASKATVTETNTVLAYTHTPSFLSSEDKARKQRKFRNMVICFDSFFSKDTALTQQSKWESSTSWIFELLDTYFILGRTAKWNPRAWIFAGINFRSVASSSLITKTSERKLVDWLNADFSKFRCLQNNVLLLSTSEKKIIDVIKKARTLSEKEAIVDSISRFAFTLLFALSVSIAILRNTFDHFKDTLEDETDFDKKKEPLQMVHYQLMKVCDLKHRCRSMERLFRNLGSRNQISVQKKRKKTKRPRSNNASAEKTNIQIIAELTALQLRETVVRFFQPSRFIPSEVLWISLTDSSHDSLIVFAVNNIQQCWMMESISEVVQTRLNLIEHLATGIGSFSTIGCIDSQDILVRKPPLVRQYAARCLRLASFLLLKLPFMKEIKESHALVELLVKLISEYLRLVCAILISKTDVNHQKLNIGNDDFLHFFCLYLSLIGSKQPLKSTIDYKGANDSATINDFKTLICNFQQHIEDCHTSITCHLLEALSIFAARSDPSIMKCVIDFHWKATFMRKYANAVNHMGASEPPYVLTKILKSLSHFSPDGYSNSTAQERSTRHTLLKLMASRFNKSGEKNMLLIHSMCRHWALLALSQWKISLFTVFLETLLGKLVEYLKDVDDCFVGQKASSKESDESSDDGDGEYVPPSTSSSQFCKSSIPSVGDLFCLTSSSYPIFFDMVLRSTVSSIALFSVPEAMSSFQHSATVSYKLHPVYKLDQMIAVYGSLIKLYTDKFHIFPKSLLPSIVNASKTMLDTSAAKLQEYVEWRNYQPIISMPEIESGFTDPASTIFLKSILDAFGVHVVGTLRLFCSVHLEPTNSLIRKTERTYDLLRETSNRYNTGEIKSQVTGTMRHTSQGDIERQNVLFQSQMSLEKGLGEGPTETVGTMIDNASLIRKRKSNRSDRQLLVEGYNPNDLEDDDSFVHGDDESSSFGSDAFGVSGNWGQDDHSTEEEDDPKIDGSVREIKMTK